MALTKNDIIDSVTKRYPEHSRASAMKKIETLLEIMKKTLERGESVMISRFGKFYVLDKNERKGRNPETRESMMLRGRRVVRFKCSGALREKLNK